MAYCRNCGTQLIDGAKFCQKCGCSVINENAGYTQRKQEFAGKQYKCPNCGEAIESRREYEKPCGLFAAAEAQQRVSKTDEQKISLIKSFSVPNTKEDMLEFMILATSSMNMRTFDSANTDISKSEKEVTAAWFSKVQQVYEKAKRSYSTDSIFTEIKALYDSCNDGIKKSKKKGIIRWVLMLSWMPIVLILIIVEFSIFIPKWEKEEIDRLDNIVLDVQRALESGEYSHALRIAESIDYQRSDVEMERKWDIEREYWVDKVLEEAAANGVILEYTPAPDVDEANDEPSDSKDTSGGFVEGFKDGMQPGLDAAKENIDEFNRILNGEDSSDSDAKE